MKAALPGEDLIEAGLQDLREQRETAAALVVAIGAPRHFAGLLSVLSKPSLLGHKP